MTAAFPSCFGEARKAACIEFRTPGLCMRMRSESNSALKLLILDSGALARAVYSSMEIRTALGASCFVITTTPPCMAFSSRRPNLFFASVAVTKARFLSVVAMASLINSYVSYLSLTSQYGQLIGGGRSTLEGAPSKLRLGGDFLRVAAPHRRNDSLTLPPPRRPLRLNFHRSRVTAHVVTKTAPSPILGTLDHPALDRITVNIPKLLHELAAVSGRPSPLPKLRCSRGV